MICLNGDFLGFLELRIKEAHGLMILFPHCFESVEFFGIGFVSKEIFEMFFQPGYTFVFGYHFLEVAPALGGCSVLQVLRQGFKDFAKSKLG